MERDPYKTDASLLERMQNLGDDEAWYRFEAFYRNLVLSFCMKRGCSKDLAEEVLQTTLIKLMDIMPDFRYDPRRGSFRSYLLAIVFSRMIDAFRRQAKYRIRIGGDVAAAEAALAGLQDKSLEAMQEEWDHEWKLMIIRMACDILLEREDRNFWAYYETEIKDPPRTVGQVAEELGVTQNNLYQMRKRGKEALQAEVKRLTGELG